MLVKKVMIKKVRTVSPDASYSEILKLLVKHKITGVPVVDKKGKVVGIVSEKDLFRQVFPSEDIFYKDPEFYMNFDRIDKNVDDLQKLKAKDVMSNEIISISSEDHILKACSLFIRHKIRRLPVIDDGKLVGIVSTNNIYKHFLVRLSKLRRITNT